MKLLRRNPSAGQATKRDRLGAGLRAEPPRSRSRRAVALVTAAVLPAAMALQLGALPGATAAAGPTGSGFTVSAGDLAFILKQIKIAERHASTYTPANPCGTLVGPAANQIPDRLSSFGLRTVDGSCNNLFAGRETFAAADQPFLRHANPDFRAAEGVGAGFFGPGSPEVPSSSYAQKKGDVFDTEPRTVSNLIVDQTSTNPAAIEAAGFPVRTQGNPGKFPCTTDPDLTTVPETVGSPAGCVPSHHTLDIPNVTTDFGLSPPYNSWFTFFGQFFDHGVDQTVKGGATVYVPLRADDPLVLLGPDGKANTGDEVPASQRFMVLTRALNQPGADGVVGDDPSTPGDESADDKQNADNTDSPWVDQSQTYTSHSSHQVFLREYKMVGGRPVSTGKLLGGAGSQATGMSTWATTKAQAASMLGLRLQDKDVTDIPMLAADPYGKFIPGPNGLPQYVTASGLVEGDLANPVPVPANVRHFHTPFLTDIAHNADPSPQDTDHNPATDPVAPDPDEDTTASADFAHQPAGTYDDEMLDAHFTAGDGRVNENLALSAVHQVFHSEHDRLVDDIKNTLTNDTSPSGVAALAEWHLGAPNATEWNGERLFQAARFVTEMEYQHLVFEEFGRKVQPGIRPFHVYSPDINPAIHAEFAHAVYRFGHSMLDDEVARRNEDGSNNSVPLLKGFLNPPEYFKGGSVGALSPEAAAGSIVMGSVDQVGNELDEFVNETLRNNLLGLPLDLPTLNMARARDAGVPRLNGLRRQIHGQTNDAQLAPYTSWADFGQNIKHPASLVNFVAAYGKHPTIVDATTLKEKRDAARAIVDPRPLTPASGTTPEIPADVPPDDAGDFMFGSGDWADSDGVTTTGVDDVDLWVGGLAEMTNNFGGLLGSTFNYVFQTQLEDLQDGDRLYYLARTPGMNLRTQLEGNSFAELIQRNTDGTNSLKADVFATADCKFQIGSITWPYDNTKTTTSMLESPPLTPLAGAGTVNDDPGTDCDENQLLLRKPDGTIQYRQFNKIDPSGVNGQSVYNGTAGVDRMWGGNDNDTFWGANANDIIEGNGGDDVALGGNGNDRVTDLSGADVLKGGPGHDALDGGIGDDLFMGGDGQDFFNGGANDNEAFAGPDDDFVIAGQGADAVFGDGGDDWIQGGSGQDLLQGDHSAPFFDDPAETAPGHDIFVGQVGENDYDSEGGDDIMAQNAAVDRNAGAGGFDWAIHQYDTVGGDDDMEINNNLVGVPIQVVVNRDRWQEVEANSGSKFNDVIKGTSVAPNTLGGAGFTGCDALDQAGVDRIAGLDQLVTTFPSPLAPIVAASASGACPLKGNAAGNVWAEGDILIGGGGSDTITGRGADDIIDGDRAVNVRISVRDAANHATEIGGTDLMENQYQRDASGALTGPTLQAAVFAGTVEPDQLVATREIVLPPASDASAIDTAVFLGPRSSYTLTPGAGGSLVVNQTVAPVAPQKVSDGVDTLRNVERLQFTNANGTTETVVVATPAAPTIGTATAGNANATVRWTAPVSNGSPAITSYQVIATPATGAPITRTAAAGATSLLFTGLTNGTAYTFRVTAVNQLGAGTLSAASNSVTPSAPVAPGTPTIGTATAGIRSATVTWTAPTTGGAPTGYTVQARGTFLGTPNVVLGTVTVGPTLRTATVTGLGNNTTYRLRVRANGATTNGAFSADSNAVTTPNVPNAPVIGTAVAGAPGGAITATANWAGATTTGGRPITGYRVSALRMSAAGAVLATTQSAVLGATVRTLPMALPVAGNYRFTVVAINAVGTGPASARSNLVAGQ
ncbi:MAG: heme peroxidase [Marmoricola sp.]|nr:heme peroxidase [Marmoricola sp.]